LTLPAQNSILTSTLSPDRAKIQLALSPIYEHKEQNMSTPSDGNGISAQELFSTSTGYTFSDVGILPGFSTKNKYSIETHLTASLRLPLPVVSSPMDTVTESKTASAMALAGGLGFIHMNLSVQDAVLAVQRVKRSQMGIVPHPICCLPSDPINKVAEIKQQHGFATLLITKNGTMDSPLIGMVTKGHVAMAAPESTLADIMIPVDKLVCAQASQIATWSDALSFFREVPEAHKVPILNPAGTVAGFFTRRDVVNMTNSPNAVVHPETNQLRVGAAVSTHTKDQERIDALLAAGVDVLLIDSAQGASSYAVDQIKYIRRNNGSIPIVAGNVVTPAQAHPLIDAGANALRVGMGTGSICTTQGVTGIGRAQLSAIYHIARSIRERNDQVTVIADGGIGGSGDMFKAIACGASLIMLGRFLAGHDETPAETVQHNDRRYKRYRGMGSPQALAVGGAARYGTSQTISVTQGVEGLVPATGPLAPALAELAEQLRKGFEYVGCNSIPSLHDAVTDGHVRFEIRSAGAQQEGNVHGISPLQ